MKKILGYSAAALGLIVYIFLIIGLIEVINPGHIAFELLLFAIAGIGWIFPAMWLIKRIHKPKNS